MSNAQLFLRYGQRSPTLSNRDVYAGVAHGCQSIAGVPITRSLPPHVNRDCDPKGESGRASKRTRLSWPEMLICLTIGRSESIAQKGYSCLLAVAPADRFFGQHRSPEALFRMATQHGAPSGHPRRTMAKDLERRHHGGNSRTLTSECVWQSDTCRIKATYREEYVAQGAILQLKVAHESRVYYTCRHKGDSPSFGDNWDHLCLLRHVCPSIVAHTETGADVLCHDAQAPDPASLQPIAAPSSGRAAPHIAAINAALTRCGHLMRAACVSERTCGRQGSGVWPGARLARFGRQVWCCVQRAARV